jgi:hypothetical protein
MSNAASCKQFEMGNPCFSRVAQVRHRSLMEYQLLNVPECIFSGTGKSRVLTAIINSVPSSGLYITASTGLAAVNIGGCTLHSFAGVGRANGTLDEIVAFVRRSRNSCNRWEQCRLLIIDEISMLDGDLFDKLEHVARVIRENDQPFGGIQLALCGGALHVSMLIDLKLRKTHI